MPVHEKRGTVSRPRVYESPVNDTEKKLQEIWESILGIKKVGRTESFFELGGTSLNATIMVSRIHKEFSVELRLRSIFENNTLKDLASLISKTGQLEKSKPQIIKPLSRKTNTFPLSFAQQRLWFLHQLNPGNYAYNISGAVRLKGELDIEAFEKALVSLQERHESLRTIFTNDIKGNPVQVIQEKGRAGLSVTNIRGLADKDIEEEIKRRIDSEAKNPFDLSSGPLSRFILLKLKKTEHVFILTMHHIMSDGWSMGVFVKELGVLYRAYTRGQVSPLRELPIQYADFTHWQKQWLKGGDVFNEQLSYWKQKLGSRFPVLQLPSDRPRLAIETYNGARLPFKLTEKLTNKLKELSRREGATLFMTLLAAFNTLLYRYTGQENLAVGSPIANRNRVEIEGLIGFFVNTLVLRTDISNDLNFLEILKKVKDVCLGAYAHQDMPFERLVEVLQPERNLSHSPLFQVMFILQNAPQTPPGLTGVDVTQIKVEKGTALFELTLEMWEKENCLKGEMEYRTDLFNRATIARLGGSFMTLLESITADPCKPISELQLLTKKEREKILIEWNDTEKEYPKNKSIHKLFEEQVERAPDKVALTFGDDNLTYRDLNKRSNQLAYYLKSLGVGPETLVGICLERSKELIVGLLGILKAGGAYVPLDPAYPKELLSYIMADAKAPVLVTVKRLSELLPAYHGKEILLDKDYNVIGKESMENPSCEAVSDSLAYVLYTSGFTGKPKGVLGLHRSTINRFNWMWRTYPFKEGEVCCQKTSLNFVDSVWEIFGPLLQGIKIVIIPDEVVKDPQLLIDTLAENHVTRIVLVPSLLRVILNTYKELQCDLQARVPELNFWISSGEALSLELAENFREIMTKGILLNLYGTSEVSADVTCFDTAKLSEGHLNTPIGRPIDNTQIYVLDNKLDPVPVGVIGEIYVGGDGLSRGYLNNPEFINEKFIANPFNNIPEDRLYRTGDIARYLYDGNIEFLGRSDHQVKIRGFRIEPGEIEKALGHHPSVREAVVIAREDTAGDLRLVAYLVTGRKPAPLINDIRDFIKERLPEYMLPSAFVFLDSLPLTPNGKVDFLALAAPDSFRPDLAAPYQAPRNKHEKKIAEIWSDVLGIERVGIYDNFFDLGGHSLLATRLITRLRITFQVDLPLLYLFLKPNIAGLAKLIMDSMNGIAHPAEIKQWIIGSPVLVPIQPKGDRQPFFIAAGAHANEDEFLRYLSCLVPHMGLDQPVYGFRPRGLDGRQKAHTSVEAMAAEYINEMRSIQPEGPYLIGGECIGGMVAFEMAQQLIAKGQEVAMLALMDTYRPAKQSVTQYRVYRARQKYLRNLKRLKDYLHMKPWDIVRPLIQLLKKKVSMYIPVSDKQRIKSRIHRIEINYPIILRRYQPKRFSGKVTLIVNEEYHMLEPTLGWKEYAAGGLEIHTVPGNHVTRLTQYGEASGKRLRACIDKALMRKSPPEVVIKQ